MSSATFAVLLLVAGGLLTSTAAVVVFFHQERQSAEIHGWLTGGDSYPYLEPLVRTRADGQQVIAYFLRLHSNRFPVYDLQVRVQDLDNGPFAADGSALPSTILPIGTLVGNQDRFAIPALVFPFPERSATRPRRFRVELPARNGLFLQDITLIPRDGRWVTRSEFPGNQTALSQPPPIEELK